MHYSRLIVNPADPRAARTLAHPYLLHQAVMAGFDPAGRGDTRVLFRVEPERPLGKVVLLVQSEVRPQWDRAADRFFGDGIQTATKERRIELAAGQRLRFRLRANPTVRREGKRIGLYGEASQRGWLTRKLEAAGAALLDCRTVDEGLIQERDPPLELQAALYDGVLGVRDPQALVTCVATGIGPAKAFGFGLLSLAPAG